MKLGISLKLLLASLIIALALGICSAINLSLPFILHPWDPSLFTIIGVTAEIINPFAIFVVFYLIGKKFELKIMLGTAVISIFIGLIIGYFLTNLAYWQLINNRPDVTNQIDIFSQLLSSLALGVWNSIGTFFVIFASLALGYLLRKESMVESK